VRLGRVDEPEAALERLIASSAIWPAISTPVGPAPTTTKVQQLLAPLRVAGPLRLLEGPKDAAAKLQRVVDRLHARRELGEVVVAKYDWPAPAAMMRLS